MGLRPGGLRPPWGSKPLKVDFVILRFTVLSIIVILLPFLGYGRLISHDEAFKVFCINIHFSSSWESHDRNLTAPDPFSHRPNCQAQIFSGLFKRQKTWCLLIFKQLVRFFLNNSCSLHCTVPKMCPIILRNKAPNPPIRPSPPGT